MSILTSDILGATKFEQAVISMALVHLCNQASHVGQEMQQRYNAWKDEQAEPMNNPWRDLHQFTLYVPHPNQQYDGMTLQEGLTRGYNVEVEPVEDRSKVPYDIPSGAHFVMVLKQKGLDQGFKLAATGLFIRTLAVLSLDIIVDPLKPDYKSLVVKHPIIREYPSGWEQKLKQFINRDIQAAELPDVVSYVDQTVNSDYRVPSWDDINESGKGMISL